MRHFEAEVELANRKLKSAAVALAVVGAIMGTVLLSAWWLTRGDREPTGAGGNLARIHDAALLHSRNTGVGYPQRMSDLLHDGYVSPEVFGLGDDWRTVVEAARASSKSTGRVQRLGAFRFAPLDEPTRQGSIVFAWVSGDEERTWTIIFDDGHVEHVSGDPAAIFEKDAWERRERGLPTYEWNASP